MEIISGTSTFMDLRNLYLDQDLSDLGGPVCDLGNSSGV